ncbi:TPA: hypothetical protein NQI75_005375 [Pseudomonas aeruginosa]|nr:hypothetical protein [Pseudomonas aeruginosa]HCH7803213.1 hypothetical protein [Pseudomonas aeruginosa]HCI4168612.1 hypothetical protein [Pseudomonas aeruginosa]HCI7165017.1 hypothetical protein [Pseudomonas aeruginosa]HCJ0752213.1 hypothetical protein [Pseudomonas aeruginosa]
MPSEKYPPAICRSPLIDYLAGIGSHAVMILTLRHSGQELRSISSRHAAGLMAVAVGMVAACTHLAPSSNSTVSPVSCALFALLIAAVLRTFGMHTVAGYAAFLMATEPVALAIRHLPMGDLIDAVFSFWCFAALSVYGVKCAKSRMELP